MKLHNIYFINQNVRCRSVPADVAKGWEDLQWEWNTTFKVSWLIIEDWIDVIILHSTLVLCS